MATTLIINPGSSSKKYALWRDGRCLASFRFERQENNYELCTEAQGQQQKCEGVSIVEYTAALRQVLDAALRTKLIDRLQEITRVGIRVVAPGTFFQSHRIIDELCMHKLREREPAAPLHIPHLLQELELLKVELPDTLVVGVSDSAFHSTMPDHARDYSIEAAETEAFDVHRFGYHGISYASVIKRISTYIGRVPSRLVLAHIGSGMSMTAVQNGQSIDTTMGFSPASGLVMGSRAGDLEAGALLELMRVKNMKLFDAQTYIQTRGGLRGLTGEADFRHILDRVSKADEVAQAALHMVVYRFQKQLGAYQVALGGLDALVLTATAVERSAELRAHFLEGLSWFGIELSPEANDTLARGGGVISTADSRITVVVIPTQEIEEMVQVTEAFVSA